MAFIGEELQPRRNVRICIDGGVIASIEPGRASELVILPGFVNAHTHVLDYGVAGLVSQASSVNQLLSWPDGLKARSIRLAYCRMVSSLPLLFRRLRRMGYAVIVAFIEGGGELCKLAKSIAAREGVALLAYGRGESIEELEGCDGLGVPVLTGRWVRVARGARSSGLRVAAHVSETPCQALQDDYLVALSLQLDHVVHLLHAPCGVHRILAESSVLPVYTPLANSIHWGLEPRLCSPRYALGGDNAGWCPQSPWELMRWVVYRKRRLGLRRAAEEALRAATLWPLEKFVGVKSVEEGEKPVLTILHAPEIVHAVDPLSALVLVGDSTMVVDVLAHLEPYGKP